jgi:tetratricopeptide (TPR) repeat protein
VSDRLQQLQNFLKASPGDTFILFAIAKEYEKLQDHDKAFEYYLLLKEKDANYVGLYYHLGKLYEEKGAIDTAVETYKTGMQVAKQQGDQHALSELAGAKLNLVDDDDDDYEF